MTSPASRIRDRDNDYRYTRSEKASSRNDHPYQRDRQGSDSKRWERGVDVETDTRVSKAVQGRSTERRFSKETEAIFDKVKYASSSIEAAKWFVDHPEIKRIPEIVDCFFREHYRDTQIAIARNQVFDSLRGADKTAASYRGMMEMAQDLGTAERLWQEWKDSPRFHPSDTQVEMAFLYAADRFKAPRIVIQLWNQREARERINSMKEHPGLYNAYIVGINITDWGQENPGSLNPKKQELDRASSRNHPLEELKVVFDELEAKGRMTESIYHNYAYLALKNESFLEVVRVYELARKRKLTDRHLHKSYITALVELGRMQDAEKMVRKLYLDDTNWRQILRLEDDALALDLHGYSHAVGFVIARILLQSDTVPGYDRVPDTIKIIHGLGKHDPQKRLLRFARYLDGQFTMDLQISQQWSWAPDSRTDGVTIFTRKPRYSQIENVDEAPKPGNRSIQDLIFAARRKKTEQ